MSRSGSTAAKINVLDPWPAELRRRLREVAVRRGTTARTETFKGMARHVLAAERGPCPTCRNCPTCNG